MAARSALKKTNCQPSFSVFFFDHLLDLLFAELAAGVLLAIGYHHHNHPRRAICFSELAEAAFQVGDAATHGI